jgi:hypothetical protein
MFHVKQGPLAQLVERCIRIAEVIGSNPIWSTMQKPCYLARFLYLLQVALLRRTSAGRQVAGCSYKESTPKKDNSTFKICNLKLQPKNVSRETFLGLTRLTCREGSMDSGLWSVVNGNIRRPACPARMRAGRAGIQDI